MASDFIQLPTDSSGKRLAAQTWTQATQTVYGQQIVICDASGNIVGVTAGRLQVDGSGVTQPVSAASLPLPASAAQEHTTAASPHSVRVSDGTNFLDPRYVSLNGTLISPQTVPTNGSGQAALPVYVNAIQSATYFASARGLATGTLTANTAKSILSFEHAAGSTKTVRIRRIIVAGYQTTALAGTLDIELTRGSAASSGGTAVTPIAANPADPAADTTVKTLPTITAATVVVNWPFAATPTTAATAQGSTVLYDWQEAGDTKPLTLRAGNLDTLVLNAISTAAQAWTLTVAVTFTEE